MFVTLGNVRSIVCEVATTRVWLDAFVDQCIEMLNNGDVDSWDVVRSLVLNGVPTTMAKELSDTIRIFVNVQNNFGSVEYWSKRIKEDIKKVGLRVRKYRRVKIRVGTDKHGLSEKRVAYVYVQPDMTVKIVDTGEDLWVFDPQTLVIERLAEWDDIGAEWKGRGLVHVARLEDIESGKI